MTTEMISIEVDSETARVYRGADQQRRAKLAILLRWGLAGVFDRDARTLVEIMHDIGMQAQANGLTPEILQSILDEPDDE